MDEQGCFSRRFCTKTKLCELVASMYQKWIITKTEQCERSLICLDCSFELSSDSNILLNRLTSCPGKPLDH